MNFLFPLGRGVSGSVFVVKIVNSPKNPQIINFLFALKIFKTDSAAVAQGENEILVLSLTKRAMNTSKNISFPAFLTSLSIDNRKAILMEVGGPTLYQGLGMRHFKGLPLTAVRTFLTNILSALSDMENKGLVHGDIKPENILFSLRRFGAIKTFSQYKDIVSIVSRTLVRDEFESKTSMDVILIDWSSSSVGYQQQAQYMQSRYYRAPEILLRATYGPATDIWSTACVAVELLLGKPLFPGKDEVEMLQLIQRMFGNIPQTLLKNAGPDSVCAKTDAWKDDSHLHSPGSFEQFIKEETRRDDKDITMFINLIRSMLQINPDARSTASSALMHPFISGKTNTARTRRRESAINFAGYASPLVMGKKQITSVEHTSQPI